MNQTDDFSGKISEKRSKRKLSLFGFCLFFAICAWFFTSFSKKYTYEVFSNLAFINAPAGSKISEKNTISVRYEVESTGWQLFFLKIKKFPDSLAIDIGRYKNQNRILLSNFIPVLNDKLGAKFSIKRIFPDTLQIGQINSVKRKVPVKLNLVTDFAKQYYFSGKITCVPDSVELTGSENMVNKILFWPAEKVILSKINQSQNLDINLEKINLNVQVEPKTVKVNLPVEEFTENKIQIPIKIINAPENFSITIYPAIVNLTYLVSLSNFKNINTKDFEAIVDYSMKNDNADYLNAVLVKFPEMTRNQSIYPKHINYLLKP